jgi:8-oxo-dGTP diphosphatase
MIARGGPPREVRVHLKRRIGAYGICHDPDGRVLMVRDASASRAGSWLLPGGGLEQGEHPERAVVREVAEETGLAVEITGLREVVSEVVPRTGRLEHTDGVVYDLAVVGGRERPEVDGSTDAVRWIEPKEAAGLPLTEIAARALDLPLPARSGPPGVAGGAAGAGSAQRPSGGQTRAADGEGPPPRPVRGQRFGAYGVVTDPAGRVLLTLIAEGYPGAGRWHLPGGGTDFGEQPAEGLSREITEESGQVARITGLLTVVHHHNPAALGPEGYPIDWHSVRAIFRVTVDRPTVPQVLDSGGSTEAARWFTPDQIASVPLTDVAAAMIDRYR